LRRELAGSKKALDAELGQDTMEIAFPGGDPPSAALRHLLRETGYRTAVGTRWGVNRDVSRHEPQRGFIRRCTARGGISPAMARRVIEADAWLSVRSSAREATLRSVRRTLGATRYARCRRSLLDMMAGGSGR
jgi:hypothetical protein